MRHFHLQIEAFVQRLSKLFPALPFLLFEEEKRAQALVEYPLGQTMKVKPQCKNEIEVVFSPLSQVSEITIDV